MKYEKALTWTAIVFFGIALITVLLRLVFQVNVPILAVMGVWVLPFSAIKLLRESRRERRRRQREETYHNW